MQPVQDLTVEDRVSRTQYPVQPRRCPIRRSCARGRPRFVEQLQALPELRDVASDQQNEGLQARLVIDRDTASRFGITPQMIDDALYDAFGQRQVSTIFTQLNQYRVVLEVKPQFQQTRPAGSAASIYVCAPADAADRCRSQRRSRSVEDRPRRRCRSTTRGSFRWSPCPSTSRLASRWATRCRPSTRPSRRSACRPASGGLSGHGAGVPGLAGERTAADSGGAGHGLHRARRAVRELHSSGHDSLDAASAGVGALAGADGLPHDLNVIALIGIILLIGIVKKNAIMMIDFALEAERKEGKTPQEAIYQACLLRFRPIMMTTMAALLGGVPLAFGGGIGVRAAPPAGHRDRSAG